MKASVARNVNSSVQVGKFNTFLVIVLLLTMGFAYSDHESLNSSPLYQAEFAENLRFGKGTITGNAAFNSDGTVMAVATSIGIWLYDVETFQPISLLEGHADYVLDLTWSPNDQHIVSRSLDETVRLWNLADKSGEVLAESGSQSGYIRQLSWSPDGQSVAMGYADGTLKLYNLARQEFEFTSVGQTEGIFNLSWSLDGTYIAVSGIGQAITVWDMQERMIAATLMVDAPIGESVAWSLDGKYLFSGDWDGILHIWDTNNWQEVKSLVGHEERITSIATLSNGNVASGDESGLIKIWDINAILEEMSGQNDDIHSTDLSLHMDTIRSLDVIYSEPLGREVLLSAGLDNTIQLWDTESALTLNTLTDFTYPFQTVDWSPDNHKIVAGDRNGGVYMWDTTAVDKLPIIIAAHESFITSVRWSPDGTKVASGGLDKMVKIWDAETGALISTLDGHTKAVLSIDWALDSSQIISGSDDGTVKVWDVMTSSLLYTLVSPNNDTGNAVAWSPDNQFISSAGDDSKIIIWSPVSSDLLRTLPASDAPIINIDWSPDGKRIAIQSNDSVFRVWEFETNTRHDLENSASGGSGVDWSLDGIFIATSSEDIVIWDAIGMEQIAFLTGHLENVNAVKWSGDNFQLASAGNDGTIRIWGN